MEDFEQSSLEEKVDLGNFVLFPPDSCVNNETGEVNFRIKDEPSEIKINDEISENNNIKKETIHSGRSYYKDLLVIKMAVLTMFQEIWSQFKNPSTN